MKWTTKYPNTVPVIPMTGGGGSYSGSLDVEIHHEHGNQLVHYTASLVLEGPGLAANGETSAAEPLGQIEVVTEPVLREYRLQQNYPNPINPSTTIRYALPSLSHVTLTVFNTLGQIVRELVNGDMNAGYHEVKFDATGLPSGLYFYRIQAGTFVETRKLLLVR